MPNSNLSGYSTASKPAIAMISAEMARKDSENATPISYLKWMPCVFDNERLNKLLKWNEVANFKHFV